MASFVIQDGSAVPVAVVETGHESAQAFTRDLEWVRFDLSRRDEHGLVATTTSRPSTRPKREAIMERLG